jgi:hypothetical protein
VICHIGIYADQQVLLGFEVVVNETSGYPGLFTNLIDGECRHTALTQAGNTGLYQFLSSLYCGFASVGDFFYGYECQFTSRQ